jgi:fumarate reductase subunit D
VSLALIEIVPSLSLIATVALPFGSFAAARVTLEELFALVASNLISTLLVCPAVAAELKV